MKMSTSMLITSRLDVILKDLALCKFRVDRHSIPSVIAGLFATSILWPFHLAEFLYYKVKTKNVRLEKPVFIVGHWRSGTTMWQYALAQDKRFSYLDPMSGYCVNTALWRPILKKPLGPGLKAGRGFDNMEFREGWPWEEYFTFAQYSHYSSWTTNMYPQNRALFGNYAFVDELPLKDQKKWFRAYDNMMRKFTVQCGGGRPMLLKSPDVTARVKFMYEKYPDAVFINLYRNPYTVIRSTINMYKVTTGNFGLQPIPSPEEEEEFLLAQFKRMYLKFFEDVKSIPAERFIEFKFEDFEKDPMPMLKETYEKFGWDWDAAKDALRAYWDGQTGYKKNKFDYSPHLIQRVNDELGFYFEHYGYEKWPVPDETIYM